MKIARSVLSLCVLKKEPVSLVHFVTRRCNARCGHCFIDFNNPLNLKDELTLTEIRTLTMNLGGSLLNVNLTGGEPFLRDDLFDIAEAYFRYAKVKSVFISTNGMFTERTTEFIDRFNASNIDGRLIFSISIDGFEDSHDSSRGVKGIFKNALETYRMVKAHRRSHVMSNINITITQDNYNSVLDLYRHLKKIGVDSITVTMMREEGAIKNINICAKKKIAKAYSNLTKLKREDIIKGKIKGFGKKGFWGRLIDSKNIILAEIMEKMYLAPKAVSACHAAALFGVINTNGDLYPCEILNGPLGNLRDYSMNFTELWNSRGTKFRRKAIKDTKCNCAYGCAWTINIFSNPKFLVRLAYNFLARL